MTARETRALVEYFCGDPRWRVTPLVGGGADVYVPDRRFSAEQLDGLARALDLARCGDPDRSDGAR